MAAITILSRNNVPTGPFTREQVAEQLRSGEIALDQLAFVAGLSQWIPLEDVLARIDGGLVSSPPPPTYSYAATMQPPGHLNYAGFWLRFVAHLLDALIISVPVLGVLFIFAFFSSISFLAFGVVPGEHKAQASTAAVGFVFVILFLEMAFYLGLLIAVWLYHAKLESGPIQATYGKRIMGLKVTGMTGERITFGHATGRFFAKIVSALPCHFGYIMAGFTERKQALHDLIAGTLVVRE